MATNSVVLLELNIVIRKSLIQKGLLEPMWIGNTYYSISITSIIRWIAVVKSCRIDGSSALYEVLVTKVLINFALCRGWFWSVTRFDSWMILSQSAFNPTEKLYVNRDCRVISIDELNSICADNPFSEELFQFQRKMHKLDLTDMERCTLTAMCVMSTGMLYLQVCYVYRYVDRPLAL